MPSVVRTRVAVTSAAAALAATALIGCDALDKALDCGQVATDISMAVDDLREKVSGGGGSPETTKKALDEIEKDLGKVTDKRDDTDLDQAINDLQTAVDKAQKAAESGDATPDLSGIKKAAGHLSKVCTS
ncbi:DNA-binding protein [Streptomyces botrytidirepellens]|uniref:Uncharacterized protein n=1 Tax=Streptomyces botrytidirepellens TaxID=2486417 RepID=A0A3M8VMB8_9ACTN|nr:DNA-binding protein [Streptomyces botrytidirepellens]RNG18828.1 hypothetical protein EEJ42_25715 [Streptomyces botrytidirepellens]